MDSNQDRFKEAREFLRKLPKAELHIHIEGTLEPELMFKLASRNNLQVEHARDIEHLRSLYNNFTDLQSFLDVYYAGVKCLRTEQDFAELTMAYMQRVHEDGCRHVELFFDPQSHTSRGIPFRTVLAGIRRGLDEAHERFGITGYLIMCFLRHLSEEDALETLEQARPYLVRKYFYTPLI